MVRHPQLGSYDGHSLQIGFVQQKRGEAAIPGRRKGKAQLDRQSRLEHEQDHPVEGVGCLRTVRPCEVKHGTGPAALRDVVPVHSVHLIRIPIARSGT